jgi:hypothetical protein
MFCAFLFFFFQEEWSQTSVPREDCRHVLYVMILCVRCVCVRVFVRIVTVCALARIVSYVANVLQTLAYSK